MSTGHLGVEVRYDSLVARGALDLYDEDQIRGWLSGRDSMTVGEALTVRAPAGIIFWAVLREFLVGDQVLHQIAVDVASEMARRRREEGVYIDFRSERGLATKQAWLDGERSLGEVLIARQQVEQAAADVADHDDPRTPAVAHIIRQAMLDDADEAVSQTYYSFIDVFGRRADHAWLVECAGKRLAEATA